MLSTFTYQCACFNDIRRKLNHKCFKSIHWYLFLVNGLGKYVNIGIVKGPRKIKLPSDDCLHYFCY